ncbi:MAG: DUF4384 domain-containing protein [Aureispira sp.]|nr:DUF4384 domain-containing protein [Aureispira sp.]
MKPIPLMNSCMPKLYILICIFLLQIPAKSQIKTWKGGSWMTILEKANFQQKYSFEEGVPLKKIKSFARKKLYVSSLLFEKNKWLVVASEDSTIQTQNVILSEDFPKEWIDDQYTKGYVLSGAAFGNKKWVVTTKLLKNKKQEAWAYGSMAYCHNFVELKLERDQYRPRFSAFGDQYWIISTVEAKEELNLKSNNQPKKDKHSIFKFLYKNIYDSPTISSNKIRSLKLKFERLHIHLPKITFGQNENEHNCMSGIEFFIYNPFERNKQQRLLLAETFPFHQLDSLLSNSDGEALRISTIGYKSIKGRRCGQAEEYYTKALKLKKDGNCEDALATIDSALAIYDKLGTYWSTRAGIIQDECVLNNPYETKKDKKLLKLALKDINKALRYDETPYNGYSKVLIFQKLKRYPIALKTLNSIGGDNSWFYQKRAYLHECLQNYDLAIKDYHTTIILEPSNQKREDYKQWMHTPRDLKSQKKSPVLEWDQPIKNNNEYPHSDIPIKACIKNLTSKHEIRLRVNNDTLKIDALSDPLDLDCTHYINKNVQLLEEKNELQILYTLKGDQKGFPAISIHYKKSTENNAKLLLVDFKGDRLSDKILNNVKQQLESCYGIDHVESKKLLKTSKADFIDTLKAYTHSVKPTEKFFLYLYGNVTLIDGSQFWELKDSNLLSSSIIDSLFEQIPTQDKMLVQDPSYYYKDIYPYFHWKDRYFFQSDNTYSSLRSFCPNIVRQNAGDCTGYATGYAARTILEARMNNWTDPKIIQQNAFSPVFTYRAAKTKSDNLNYSGDIQNVVNSLINIGAVKHRDFRFIAAPPELEDSIYQIAQQYKIKSAVNLWQINQTDSERLLATCKAIHRRNPIVLGLIYSDSLKSSTHYKNTNERNDPENIGHAVCIIGYAIDSNGLKYELMNSWGTRNGFGSIGEDGYFWIYKDDLAKYALHAYEIKGRPSKFSTERVCGDIGLIDHDGQLIDVQLMHHSYFRLKKHLRVGARFRFMLNNDQENYIYILTQDAKGQTSIVYPQSEEQNVILNPSITNLTLPNKHHHYRLEEEQANKPFIFIKSAQKIDTQTLLQRVEKASGIDLHHKTLNAFNQKHELKTNDFDTSKVWGGHRIYYDNYWQNDNNTEKVFIIPLKVTVID